MKNDPLAARVRRGREGQRQLAQPQLAHERGPPVLEAHQPVVHRHVGVLDRLVEQALGGGHDAAAEGAVGHGRFSGDRAGTSAGGDDRPRPCARFDRPPRPPRPPPVRAVPSARCAPGPVTTLIACLRSCSPLAAAAPACWSGARRCWRGPTSPACSISACCTAWPPPAIVGGSLALSGVMLQSLLRNPLASPDLIGLAPGAGFGVMLATYLHYARDRGAHPLDGRRGARARSAPSPPSALVYVISQRRGHHRPRRDGPRRHHRRARLRRRDGLPAVPDARPGPVGRPVADGLDLRRDLQTPSSPRRRGLLAVTALPVVARGARGSTRLGAQRGRGPFGRAPRSGDRASALLFVASGALAAASVVLAGPDRVRRADRPARRPDAGRPAPRDARGQRDARGRRRFWSARMRW
jgi:hypothetical protein